MKSTIKFNILEGPLILKDELHDYLMLTDKKKLNKIKKIIFYKAKSNRFLK